MTLDAWIAQQHRRSVAGLLKSVSPLGLAKDRFGVIITVRRGAILASPVPGAYDPDPDYFFHWYRDSALVVEALRLLHWDGVLDAGPYFRDFVAFSESLASAAFVMPPAPEVRPFLRDGAEMAAAEIAGETRVNPDGTRDVLRWPRPQHDGPALRALTLLRWGGTAEVLIRADLRYVLAHAEAPGFDIWEEEQGWHYYPLRVSAAALAEGAAWAEAHGDAPLAEACRAKADTLLARLETYWQDGFYHSRLPESGAVPANVPAKALDASVILAAIHAGGVADPRMMATLAKLEALFAARYAINRDLPPERAAALGRYDGDTYYGGSAWYVTTLAAAELCYRAGARAHGDRFVETMRRFTPEDGALSEQFDQTSGAQTSAKELAWSHAAFLTAMAARRAA